LLVSPIKRHVDEVLFDTGSRHLYTMNKQSFDQHAYKSKNVEIQVESRAHGSLLSDISVPNVPMRCFSEFGQTEMG
jgi:hypothetical protein